VTFDDLRELVVEMGKWGCLDRNRDWAA